MFLWPCTFYRYRQKNHNGLNFLSKISKNYHVCLFIWRICSPFCLNAINKCVWLYQFQLRPRYNVIVTTFHVIVCISASQLQGKSFVKDWKRLMWFASKMQKFRRHSKIVDRSWVQWNLFLNGTWVCLANFLCIYLTYKLDE